MWKLAEQWANDVERLDQKTDKVATEDQTNIRRGEGMYKGRTMLVDTDRLFIAAFDPGGPLPSLRLIIYWKEN